MRGKKEDRGQLCRNKNEWKEVRGDPRETIKMSARKISIQALDFELSLSNGDWRTRMTSFRRGINVFRAWRVPLYSCFFFIRWEISRANPLRFAPNWIRRRSDLPCLRHSEEDRRNDTNKTRACFLREITRRTTQTSLEPIANKGRGNLNNQGFNENTRMLNYSAKVTLGERSAIKIKRKSAENYKSVTLFLTVTASFVFSQEVYTVFQS